MHIQPGWGLSQHTQAAYTGLGSGTRLETALFACPADTANCQGDDGTGDVCSEGSLPPLCAVCEPGWVGGTEDACSRCGASERRRALQERSALSDGVHIGIIVGAILLVLVILIPFVLKSF